MKGRPGPWEKGGWLRKLAALLVAGFFFSSALILLSPLGLCLSVVVSLSVIAAILLIPYLLAKERPKGGKRKEVSAAAGGSGVAEKGSTGMEAGPHGPAPDTPQEKKMPEGASMGQEAGAPPKRARGKRPRGDLTCPHCGGFRLVYEAGMVTGQYYYCKDCDYRGAFVIEVDRPRR